MDFLLPAYRISSSPEENKKTHMRTPRDNLAVTHKIMEGCIYHNQLGGRDATIAACVAKGKGGGGGP